MTKHPLWAFSDSELDAVLSHANAPTAFRNRVRDARVGSPTDDERQSLLAAWHSYVSKPDGFRWPWVALDSTAGFLPMGEMAVVLGQTGQGKTTFTSSLLNRLSPLLPVLVFATETPDDRYFAQLAARKANLDPDKVIHGDWAHAGRTTHGYLPEMETRAKYRDALDQIRASKLTVAPHLSLKASEMDSLLRNSVDACLPRVIVVDHFQAIDHDMGEGFNGQQATLRMLHQFAHDHYVTLIVTNQAHLKGQGTTPRPTDCIDLAGNFGGQTLMQFAAQVVGLHRVFADVTSTGAAITPQFVQEWRRNGMKERELYDRTKVAVDLPKIRYDANGAMGSEVRLQYREGQYWDVEE